MIKRVLISSMVTLCLASTVAAQTHLGTIRGTVSAASGSGVPRAPFTLTDETTNLTRSGITGADGRFSLTQLEPGSYRVEVAAPGYKTTIRRATLQVNQQLQLDLVLELGTLTEEVVVTAPDLTMNREPNGQSTVIDNVQLTNLPLDGRNFLELSLLAPGTVPAAQGSAGSVRGAFTLNVNGAREGANAYLLDGAYNVDPKLNTVAVRPPVDAIDEFRLLTSSYDAAFGRHAGAQVNVITKSGSNQLHGTVYEFFRNDALNATNFFAPRNEPAPTLERNQFGLSLGGPIATDRTFFFVDYEGTRLTEGITRTTTVPTLAERQGDFSSSLFPAPVIPGTQFPFPNDRIPAPFQNPIGAAIAALYPLPNRDAPGGNFVSSPELTDRNDQVDLRVDHRLGAGSSLTVRYSVRDRELFEPFSGVGFAEVPGFGTNVPQRSQNLLTSNTQVLSPSLVNDIRVSYTRVSAGAFHENTGLSLNEQVGLPELSDNTRDFGLSFITVTGFSPLGDEFNNPQQSTTNTVQAIDTMTYARGRHLLKFGADLQFTRQDAFRDVQSRGLLTFSSFPPFFTGNALADLLLGLPLVTGGARLDNQQQLRTESYNLFVQDSIQIGSNLTVSAGLRYEFSSPPVDADDRANVYDPATQSLVPVGTAGIPRSGYEADRNNVAPRIGAAWTLNDARTVVRGGWGVYYDQSALAPGEGLYFNPPFFDFNLFFPLPGLPLTLADPFPSFFPVALPPSALTFQRDLQTPYLQHWNAALQQELGSGRSVEIAYVGSRGRKLLRGRDINQAAANPSPVNPRPVPQFADIVSLESTGRSRYHALQLKAEQRLRSGLSLLAAYTLGQSEDDVSDFFSSAGDPNFPQDSNNPDAEFGRSNFDVRHRFSLSFSYDLPFGRNGRFASGDGRFAALLSDWQVAGVVTLQSGRPFTVGLLPAIDNSNTGRAALGFGSNDRPNQTGSPALSDASVERWFDTETFVFPAFGSFGNTGRNTLDGPGFANVNLALLKGVALGDAARVQLRLEAFNLFNRTNLDLPDAFLGSPTFGQIRSAQPARRLQLGLKLMF
ncbi:MAG: TonB-dependent receptor [Vicinamibacterales bacterium]|nr:TonB-dependent receptor [Vicinamibacterales bacterium]